MKDKKQLKLPVFGLTTEFSGINGCCGQENNTFLSFVPGEAADHIQRVCVLIRCPHESLRCLRVQAESTSTSPGFDRRYDVTSLCTPSFQV
jgi:hypothetical protein